jgi:hypothetical protein
MLRRDSVASESPAKGPNQPMETKARRPARAGIAAVPAEVSAPPDPPKEIPAPVAPQAQVPMVSTAPPPVGEIGRFGHEALAAFTDSQAAVVRGLSALSDEMAGLTRSGIDLAARTATEMLGVRTVADVFRVNVMFARNSFDGLIDGSAKLSGLGVRLAAESSRPILTQLGQSWIEITRLAL